MGAIVAFCSLLDWVVSKGEIEHQKVTILKWWICLDDFNFRGTVKKSNIFFNKLFNRLYGVKVLSLQCFIMSTISSFFAVFITTIAFAFLSSTKLSDILGKSYPTEVSLFGLLILVIISNVWIDFLSLVETRIVLRLCAKVNTLKLLLLLLIDIVASAWIYLVGILLIVGFFYLTDPDPEFIKTMRIIFACLIHPFSFLRKAPLSLQICFLSTFFTSAMFYLYCTSTLLFKLLGLSTTRIMNILEKLESSDSLFKALGGFVAAIIAFIKCGIDLWRSFIC